MRRRNGLILLLACHAGFFLMGGFLVPALTAWLLPGAEMEVLGVLAPTIGCLLLFGITFRFLLNGRIAAGHGIVRMPSTRVTARVMAEFVFLYYLYRTASDGIRWIRVGLTDDFSGIEAPEGASILQFLVLSVLLGIVPALSEELFHRVATRRLVPDMRGVPITLLSAALFALAHRSPETMLFAFALGIMLMRMYLATESYPLIAVCHALFNILGLVHDLLIPWVTDPIRIPELASSSGECIGWGLSFLAVCSIAIAAGLLISMLSGPKADALVRKTAA